MITIKMKPLAQACALIFSIGSLAVGGAMAAQHAPAGSSIVNQVTLTFKDAFGKSYQLKSNIINITIREIYTARFSPIFGTTQKVPADGGSEVYSLVKLYNTGNKRDTYQLFATNNNTLDTIDAADILIYHDLNGNGQLDANEMTPITNVALDAGENASLIIVTKLPATVGESDALYVDLNAISDNGAVIDKTVTEIKITFSKKSNVTTPVFTWEQKDGGNCHAYTSVPLGNADSWQDAKVQAQDSVYGGVNGHLATLNTFDEIEFVRAMVDKTQNHWLGAHRNVDKNWEWDTGEVPYIGTDGSAQTTFPQFVWANNGWNDIDNYAYIWNQTNDGKWAVTGDIWTGDDNGNPINALVEFDIECSAPTVDVVLTAAKDIACDGSADSAFDAIDLSDMAPGECAIMHVRAKNNSGISAVDVFLKQELPNYLTYIPNTISSCGFDDFCTPVARTDNETDNDNGYYDAVNNTIVIGGKPTNLQPGDVIHGEYHLKID